MLGKSLGQREDGKGETTCLKTGLNGMRKGGCAAGGVVEGSLSSAEPMGAGKSSVR